MWYEATEWRAERTPKHSQECDVKRDKEIFYALIYITIRTMNGEKKCREKGKRQNSDIKWNTIHISSRYTIGDVSVSEWTCYPLCLSQSEIRFYPCICLIRRFFGMIMGIWEPVNQTSACVSFIIWFFPHAHFVFAGIWTGETDSRKR